MPKDTLNRIIVALLHFERRFDPFFRPALDAVLREPMAAVIQALSTFSATMRDCGWPRKS